MSKYQDKRKGILNRCKMDWNKEVIVDFIALYRERPCLWKVKDSGYGSINSRRDAYKDLINFLKRKNFNNITVKEVKAKIQNLRNAFRKEARKVDSSDGNYTPNLWYYPLLIFTKDQDEEASALTSEELTLITLRNSEEFTDKVEWNREILTQLIEMYKERPCLWKEKDPSYNNKNIKHEAYEDLVNFLNTQNITNITVKEVKAKIQNLRNAFRKEARKVDILGANHTPSLWYYPLLLFTKDQDAHLASINSQLIENEEIFTFLYPEDEIKTNKITNELEQTSIKRKKIIDPKLQFRQPVTKILSMDDSDEFDAICISFAKKLKKMETKQQILAESLMHKVITEGLLNRLTEDVDIVDKRTFFSS